ncbi:uncharacterized protein LOC131212976 [Anopheles bellator]|uniref:uncharacterized protein LOC131212976 n=1 Tax=Anopheles bellator TaxID=139047 RepID=UPI00264826B9|nr:uncharacterized protein LOC131212976 [Anopheles bellator]
MKANGMRPAQLSSETMGGGHQSNRNCILDGGIDSRRQEEDGGGNGGSRRPAYQQQQRYQRQQQEQQRRVLHTVTKPKLVTPFTRFQVLRIIKLATMDKLRGEANEADNRTGSNTQQPVGSDVDGGGGPGTRVEGDRASDEFHHQFYNTGRIGRRNALPDILGTHCTTTTADLSTQLGALSTSECAGKSPEGSGLSSSIAPPNGGQPPTTTAT